MRFHPLYFLFCLSLSSYFLHGLSTCSLESSVPIYFPIKNVTLSEQIQKRGISLSVGTPEQTLVFQVTTLDIWFFLQEDSLKLTLRRSFDDIYLYDNSSGCSVPDLDFSTLLACSATVGGIWDKERSSSWRQISSVDASQSAPEFSPDEIEDLTGIETIRIDSSLPLRNFPIKISPSLFSLQNFFDFSKNSTLLNKLLSTGLIISRAWKYYHD